MTEENKNNPPQPLPAADTEVLQKEGQRLKRNVKSLRTSMRNSIVRRAFETFAMW